jgi:hypothetical protein
MEPIMMKNEEGANVGMRPTPSIKKGHENQFISLMEKNVPNMYYWGMPPVIIMVIEKIVPL